MKSDFKLTGLAKPNIMVCEFKNEETFQVKTHLSLDKFNEFWDYCKNNWSETKLIEIEYEDLHLCGRPKNPIAISIKLK